MDGYVTIGTKLDTKEFDKQIKETEAKLNDLEASLQMASEDKTLFSTREIREMEAEAEKLKNKLIDLRKKQQNVAKIDLSGVNLAMENIIKKVTKWTLAIFSVRSAYSMIRNAVSTLSQYNEQFAVDLEYIRYALASSLFPLIKKIVYWVQLLLTYINYIAKMWFGKELFASAKSFSNMQKAASGTASAVKEIKKQLTGFDEMNVLNEDGSTSAGGVAGGISAPSIDLTDWQNIKIPKWIEWIAKNKDLVLGFLKGVAVGLAAIKIAKFLSSISGLFKILKGISALQLVALIAGIVIAISGVITLIQGIISFIKDPSWKNFNKILEGLTLTLLGVGLAMVALNASNPVGWIILATGAVVGLVAATSELARAFFEDKANIKSVKQAQEDLTKAIKETKEATEAHANALDNYDNALKKAEEAAKALEEAEKKNKISGAELAKQVENGKLSYDKMTDAQKEVYKAYYNNITAQNNLKTATEDLEVSAKNLTKAKENETKASWENQLAIAKEKGNYDEFKKSVVDAFNNGELKAGEARDYIERAMAGMSKSSKQTFMEDLPSDIKNGLDPNRYDSAFSKLKTAFSNMLSDLKKGFSDMWNNIKGIFSKGVVVPVTASTSLPQASSRKNAKGAIIYPQLKYHASGGIINQPGRGVPINVDIGGEAGPEGLIPLTDAQQMAILGETIGKYVNIYLTNVTKLDNRQIAKEQKIINARNSFASNS